MNYVFASLSVVCIAIQFCVNKAYQKTYVKKTFDILIFPLITGLVSMLFFLCFNKFKLTFGGFTFLMAFILAVVSILSAILSILTVRLGKVAVYSVFMMLGGMMLPYFYGIVFLDETPSIACIIGLIVLVGALILSVITKKGSEPKPKKIFYLLCAAIFFLNGGVSIISKVHQVSSNALETYDFLIWNYLIFAVLSGIILVVFLFFQKHKKQKQIGCFQGHTDIQVPNHQEISKENLIKKTVSATDLKKSKPFLFSILMIACYALISGSGMLFMLVGAKTLPATALYPILTGGSIVLSTLLASVFFKQKISQPMLTSLVFTVIGTVLFLF